LRHGNGLFALATECGQLLRARSIVVASGARYRRPEIENLAAFEGKGVWYWASPIEAKLCADQEVGLVGGGNSAGQAAVFLSRPRAKGLHDRARRRARRQHVALTDRAHRGDAEHRADLQRRGEWGSRATPTPL
jgi:thioredoxin reductase